MKYEYKVEVKLGPNEQLWDSGIINEFKLSKRWVEDRMKIFPNAHFRISHRPVGKWEIVKEVK